MKRALIFFVLHCVFADFAGEILIQEAFNTPESVEKYPSGVKVSFDKGEKGEGGALKMEASEMYTLAGCPCRLTPVNCAVACWSCLAR